MKKKHQIDKNSGKGTSNKAGRAGGQKKKIGKKKMLKRGQGY